MPRVLVTGAAGFISSHVVECSAKLGFEMVGVDDRSRGLHRQGAAHLDSFFPLCGGLASPRPIGRRVSER